MKVNLDNLEIADFQVGQYEIYTLRMEHLMKVHSALIHSSKCVITLTKHYINPTKMQSSTSHLFIEWKKGDRT